MSLLTATLDVLKWFLRELPVIYATGFTVALFFILTPQQKAKFRQLSVRALPLAIATAGVALVLYCLNVFISGQEFSGVGNLWEEYSGIGDLLQYVVRIVLALLYYVIRIVSALLFKWFLPNILLFYCIGITVVFLCIRRPQYVEMLRYIGKRVLTFIPTLLIISFVIFFIIQLPPGDYVTSYVAAMAAEGEIFTVEQIEALRVQFGLDDPWFVQYFNWIDGIIVDGYFGYSFEYGREVWSVIMDRLYLTLTVSFVILIFQYGVSLPIGINCANHQYSAGDYVLSFFGFIGTATPNFLLAIIVYFILYKANGNMYVGLYSAEMMEAGIGVLPLPELIAKLPELTQYIPELLFRMFLVLLVIGTSGTCGIIRTVRAQMLDEQARQYTLTARAKGCSEWTITYKYCLRAALNPVVSGLAGSLRTIFSGSTVSAIVMNLAIQGPVLLAALKSQDMYLAGTTVLVQAVLVLVGTLLSDIALAWLDPRIRFAERS